MKSTLQIKWIISIIIIINIIIIDQVLPQPLRFSIIWFGLVVSCSVEILVVWLFADCIECIECILSSAAVFIFFVFVSGSLWLAGHYSSWMDALTHFSMVIESWLGQISELIYCSVSLTSRLACGVSLKGFTGCTKVINVYVRTYIFRHLFKKIHHSQSHTYITMGILPPFIP